ncbi:uncharacterized protein [Neodiprion pinetum]|uniref:uncharacterized protein n=1 Tax=Neodiprion pinetum TaxID=441929 RepID=UPI001EDEB133|nr:uncharacterized protein LOC124210656 [Neodiprion pinetum]
MPKVKQPASLEQITFDFLVDYFVDLCNRLSCKGDVPQLRRTVALIKELLFPWLPPSRRLLAEFCAKFVEKFREREKKYRGPRPESHVAAALEMIMDVDLTGLRCGYHTMRCMNEHDASRIRGLEKLDITMYGNKGMSSFRLQNLTELYCHYHFNDSYLAIVGSQCLKLRVLDIRNSSRVTDEGLRALRPCSELRVFHFYGHKISAAGTNELLSSNQKIKEFNVNYNILSRPTSQVCPAMQKFCFQTTFVDETHFRAAAALFPNLTDIQIDCKVSGDLRELRAIKNLTGLNFYCWNAVSMENLRQLLAIIGENILHLKVITESSRTFVSRTDLQYIYNICKNIQSLEFEYKPLTKIDTLRIPPFSKLKTLKMKKAWKIHDMYVTLQLQQMVELEVLEVYGFGLMNRTVESIMCNHVNFPKLRLVRTSSIHTDNLIRLNRIAKEKNLDFTVQAEIGAFYSQF